MQLKPGITYLSQYKKDFYMKKQVLSAIAFLIVFCFLIELRAEPIPEDVNQCIAYIVKPENSEAKPIGTAFFIGYNYPEQANKYYIFLVTAKHVLFDDTGIQHPRLLVRMNDKFTGHARDYDIINPRNWFFHENTTAVDIAVQPVLPKDAKFLYIASKDFITEQVLTNRKIGIGDEVFYSGLLSYHSGQDKIAPVVRFGKLALITNEITVDGKFYNFIDAGNIPGHSGAPVFLWASPARESNALVAGSRIFGLYGVVSGVIEYSKELKLVMPKQTGQSMIPVDARSGGITAIVPVKYLVEILEGSRTKTAIGLIKK